MTTPISPADKNKFIRSGWALLSDNPVLLKELRGRMRGGRAFIIVTIYLLLLGGLVSSIYFGFAAANDTPSSSMSMTQSLGKTLFGVLLLLELSMVCFVAPALTASAISGEREHQTYDLLRTTLLSARALIFGKLISALTFLVLLLIVAFPLHGLAYLLGGVALEELLIGFLILLMTALAFCAMGIFVSSLSQRVVGSTVISYIGSSLIVFGIPAFLSTLIAFIAGIYYSYTATFTTAQQSILEILLLVLGWFFVILNPIATAIGTELILLQGQSIWGMSVPLPTGSSIMILSPWIGFIILYLLFTLLLLWLSTRFVRRRDR